MERGHGFVAMSPMSPSPRHGYNVKHRPRRSRSHSHSRRNNTHSQASLPQNAMSPVLKDTSCPTLIKHAVIIIIIVMGAGLHLVTRFATRR